MHRAGQLAGAAAEKHRGGEHLTRTSHPTAPVPWTCLAEDGCRSLTLPLLRAPGTYATGNLFYTSRAPGDSHSGSYVNTYGADILKILSIIPIPMPHNPNLKGIPVAAAMNEMKKYVIDSNYNQMRAI